MTLTWMFCSRRIINCDRRHDTSGTLKCSWSWFPGSIRVCKCASRRLLIMCDQLPPAISITACHTCTGVKCRKDNYRIRNFCRNWTEILGYMLTLTEIKTKIKKWEPYKDHMHRHVHTSLFFSFLNIIIYWNNNYCKFRAEIKNWSFGYVSILAKNISTSL